MYSSVYVPDLLSLSLSPSSLSLSLSLSLSFAAVNMAGPNVYLFYPNLIGFARVALGLASFFYMQTSPYLAMALYWTSAFLDAFDGMAARHFNQSTKFGSVLDMVSDR